MALPGLPRRGNSSECGEHLLWFAPRSSVQDTLGAEILDTDLKRVGLGRSLSNALPRNKRRTSRVNGPCSALSSFLEERGIVSHRRRSEPGQGGAEQAPAEEPTAASAEPVRQDSDDDQEDEPAAPRSSRRAKNAKKAKTEGTSKQPRVSMSRCAPSHQDDPYRPASHQPACCGTCGTRVAPGILLCTRCQHYKKVPQMTASALAAICCPFPPSHPLR